MIPKARTSQMLTQEVDGELVVYDQERHEAFSLNRTAALVWQHCDGETSVSQLAELLRDRLHSSADEELVWVALEQLECMQLLQEPVPRRGSKTPEGRTGVRTFLAPVVEFLLVPGTAAAYSW